ncbi:hypothetical protein R1sor_019361 [Riccia sorocarpa]|uniref:Uncharacterized protein n=1 Tax=Riccia sorocarpa TaxID=122646 RepID=A0ABD3IFM3_9MARC
MGTTVGGSSHIQVEDSMLEVYENGLLNQCEASGLGNQRWHMQKSQAAGEELWLILDRALTKHKDNPAYIILITTNLLTNWTERNKLQFEGARKYLGIAQILQETSQEVEALTGGRMTSEKKQQQMREAASLLRIGSYSQTAGSPG